MFKIRTPICRDILWKNAIFQKNQNFDPITERKFNDFLKTGRYSLSSHISPDFLKTSSFRQKRKSPIFWTPDFKQASVY